MNKSTEHTTDQLNEFQKFARLAAYFFALITASALFVYMIRFAGNGLGGTEQFGQFGDYVGGVLNPSLSFITILLLIWSIRVQMSELAATREELAASKEELKKSSLALEASRIAHQENVELQKREYIRKQIHDDFKHRIGILESLLNKPLFPIYSPALLSSARSFTLHSFNDVYINCMQSNGASDFQIFIDNLDLQLEPGQKESISDTRSSIARNIHYLQECASELYKYLDNYYVALSIQTQTEEFIDKCSYLKIINQKYADKIKEMAAIPERILKEC